MPPCVSFPLTSSDYHYVATGNNSHSHGQSYSYDGRKNAVLFESLLSMKKNVQTASLENPFDEVADLTFSAPGQATYEPGIYEEKLEEGFELRQRPFTAAGERNLSLIHI